MLNTSIELVIGRELYKASHRLEKNIPIPMYWRIGTESYPDTQWSDAAAIILPWWMYQVQLLIDGVDHATMSFMEGPYELSFSALPDRALEVSTQEGVILGEVALRDLIKAIRFGTLSVVDLVRPIDLNGLITGTLQKGLTYLDMQESRLGSYK